ncbi:hypothetical protein DEU56DRAFT_137058 [Suillus clintonianus]|uniref:uncharacterized protein n=1 Tax=Suillus clintonianus TaxID=1904413 RepID=UPI001B86F7D2|nr:uncharacterized protein DEU56DRAFT_137058 [Suillus clintonianus]KAG2119182.1 hypothetical protein DEU56DRAFT_137058 [Suillus clintonianus]
MKTALGWLTERLRRETIVLLLGLRYPAIVAKYRPAREVIRGTKRHRPRHQAHLSGLRRLSRASLVQASVDYNDQGCIRDDLKFFVLGFGRLSVFINSLLTLWAFHLTLDPKKPLDDMGFMMGAMGDTKLSNVNMHVVFPATPAQ